MSDGLFGVLIGGLIGILSSLIPLFIKLDYDQMKINYAKKEEVYLQAIDIVTRYRTEVPETDNNRVSVSDELKKEINRMYSLMVVYSTPEIHQEFVDLISDILGSRKVSDKDKFKMVDQKAEDFNKLLITDLQKENKFSFRIFKKE